MAKLPAPIIESFGPALRFFLGWISATGNLGLLKTDAARDVATFYTYAEAISEKLNYISDIPDRERRKLSKEQGLEELSSLKVSLEELIRIGKAVVNDSK